MEAFEKLIGKINPILHSIKERGFEAPSEIQEKSIPAILQGKDVIAGASTGSGKTLAFAAGLIHNVKKGRGIQGLVLTPTRELAEQLTTELLRFSRAIGLKVIAVYGGVSINNQIRDIPYADIVVATPGRLLDHLQRDSINLGKVNTLVLDEADRMLDMGFINDVEKIIENCPKHRQTLLFSATVSADIVHLAKKYMHNPVEISAEQYVDPSKLEQVYYDVPDNLKYSLLKHLLENEKANLVMIFCNTRRNVDFVANNLKSLRIEALPIHGGFSQEKRNRVLKSFHANKVNVLVATDVAARGLDIKGVTHIYNYDIPPTQKEYVHRIGRTARAGKDGKVINILSSRDYENFQSIMTGDIKISQVQLPFLERVRIFWMPQPRNFRRTFTQGSNFRSEGNRGRDVRREDGRGRDFRTGSNRSRGFRRDDNESRDFRRNDSPRRWNSSPRRSREGSRTNRPKTGDFRRNRKPKRFNSFRR